MTQPVIDVYAARGSLPCDKVLRAMEAMEIPHNVQWLNLWKGEQRKAEFLAINSAGKVPAIRMGSFVLAESNAILGYLAERFERYDLYPQNLETRARINMWVEFIHAHLYVPMGRAMWHKVWLPKQMKVGDERIIASNLEETEKSLAVLAQILQTQKFLVGSQRSLADLSLLGLRDAFEPLGISRPEWL